MIRKIIRIDEEKCNGCGLCTSACQEGALKIVNGKAKLISDVYCDGLGNCLPGCPTGAIEIIEREAEAFDEEAVRKHLSENGLPPLGHDRPEEAPGNDAALKAALFGMHAASGCPGSRARVIRRHGGTGTATAEAAAGSTGTAGTGAESSGTAVARAESSCAAGTRTESSGTAVARAESQLGQWPCQIRLVPPGAPYFDNADLLVAADCTAFAYANIHQDFMRNKITIIGCPKLDDTDYSEKLAQILAGNRIKSITVLRMEVPCCGGLVHAVKNAMMKSGVLIPWNVVTISTDGEILE